MKILLVTNKVRTYSLVYQNSIDPLLSLGHEIIWAADFSMFSGDKAEIPCQIRQISINTWPLKKCNFEAYRQLLKIIEEEKIEAVLCSTPIGGLLARLAAKVKHIQPVIYAAHGFLFFKGAPFINRILYKWEEIWLAHYTDALITITEEDYAAAQKFKLRSGRRPYLVHGAGVNVGIQVDVDRACMRQELGVPEDAFLLVSAGELNKNKNTKVVIEALARLNDPRAYYIACGEGPERGALEKLIRERNLEGHVKLVGFRTDVAQIMAVSDAFVMPSFREGVPRALLEAMDLGLPCIGSRTRGITDLIVPDKGGYQCAPKKAEEFKLAISKLIADPAQGKTMGAFNKDRVAQYSSEVVRNELTQIYKEVLRTNQP